MKIYVLILASAITISMSAQKRIYIPKDLRQMNLNDTASQWCYARMDTTADFALFWEKGFGDNPCNPPQLDGHDMHVDMANLKNRLESFYSFFRDTLQFVRAGSNSEKYKMMVMLNYSLEGTAYGGDYDSVIGALWIAPNRVQDNTLNCIAHELGHCFQSQITCDGAGDGWGGCGFFEMASQWMLWQVNPNWIHDEAYHWDAFRKLTHKAYLHLDNIYHSPYILEYWGMKHGRTVIADLFREGKVGEDPVMTYKRMFNMSQAEFCDEMFDAVRHIVNMDYPRAWKETRPYACAFNSRDGARTVSNIDASCMKSGDGACTVSTKDGWHKVADGYAPENYGFNVIPLTVPKNGRTVTVEFRGLPGVNVTDEQKAAAGWRYGFICVTSQGENIYGDMGDKPKGKLSFKLPKDKTIAHLYLVVMGAPQTHWKNPDGGKDAAWPYMVKFKGTEI